MQFGARFEQSVVERLRARAEREREPQGRLAERYIDEGMRIDDHPGVVFRDGPLGRRAGLAAGPDVWELVDALKRSPTKGRAAVAELASLLELSEAQIETALRYYGDFPDEIDELITRSRQVARREEASWRRQQTALG